MREGREAKIKFKLGSFGLGQSSSILVLFSGRYLREYVYVLLTLPGVSGNSNRAIKIGYLKVKKNRTHEIDNLT
jgi:hypothetical protein